MKTKTKMLAATGGLLAATLATAQMMGMGGGMMMGRGAEGASMVRHRYVMANGIPQAYAAARNPLAADERNLKEGKALFESNCATCHGGGGHGDGPAAKNLNPPPADLTAAMGRPIASDAYLEWTIAEGGVPVGSAMPPFKAALSGTQIWKLVLYLHNL